MSLTCLSPNNTVYILYISNIIKEVYEGLLSNHNLYKDTIYR